MVDNLVPATEQDMLAAIGPHSDRNPAWVAYLLHSALVEEPPATRYRLRQLLTPDSPMWSDDLAEARHELGRRQFFTYVSDPSDELPLPGLQFEEIQRRDLALVYARFTETDLTGGNETVQVQGDPIPVMVIMLELRRNTPGRWRAHRLIR